MQNFSDIVLFNGEPLSGASVAVLNYPSGSLATIYIDNGITQGPNPITTNINGRYNFYAANGRYSLQISYPNTTTQTILDFPLEDDPASPQTANITSGTISGVAISNSTATTQPTLDNSALIATDAFVANEIVRSTANNPVTITGGLYNLNSLGTGLQIVIFVSGGVIGSILSIAAGGTGYAVGDVLVVAAGNVDAVVRVTSVVGGVVQTGGVSVLYGGTGYTTGLTVTAVRASIAAGNTITLTGALTSNATIVFIRGTAIAGANRLVINNNTTGAFSVSVFMSNGAGGTTGNGVVIPQGSNNSSAMLIQTDGANDVWSAVSTAGLHGTATSDSASAGSLGEYVTATATGVAITSGPVVNICSMSLTAGDWDVSGLAGVVGSTNNVTATSCGSSTTSTTLGPFGTYWQYSGTGANFATLQAIPINRLSLSATTTVYAVAAATFSTGTATAEAVLRARRVR